jgi:anti-sigma factor RsiW
MSDDHSTSECQAEDVAAYVDGELSQAANIRFEDHIKSCPDCAAELRLQRQLLCTLDVAFNNSRSFALPQNFARVVTTRAESDLRGMRHKPERRRAAKLCLALALVSFALMGAAARAIVFDPVQSFFRATRSLLHLGWEAAAGAGASVVVLMRVIARAVLTSGHGLGFSLLLVLFLSICFLLILIAKYHRAQIVE